MEIVRCEKGHFYDAGAKLHLPPVRDGGAERNTRSSVSPAAAWRKSAPPSLSPSPAPSQALWKALGHPRRLAPALRPTDFIPKGGCQVEQYESTTPVSPNGVAGFNPVVGWLVCIDGPDKGQDYRIHAGYNYIGRAQSMDICIQGDTHISNQNAGVIGYDDLEHLFSFGPSGGHNTVRVNEKWSSTPWSSAPTTSSPWARRS